MFILNYHDHIGIFDSKVDTCVFPEYCNDNRAFHVYTIRTYSIIESTNIVIDHYQDFANYSIEEKIISLLETTKVVSCSRRLNH